MFSTSRLHCLPLIIKAATPSVSQLHPLPLPQIWQGSSKYHINSARRGRPPMTSFMFSFLNTLYRDTYPEKSIYKTRLTFKCQTRLRYTTENKPLSFQKTMCRLLKCRMSSPHSCLHVKSAGSQAVHSTFTNPLHFINFYLK